MLEKVFALIKMLFTMDEELKRLRAESKLHGEQIRELATNQARMYYEFQLQSEREAHAHESEALRLELKQTQERLKQLEMLLPPSPPKPKAGEE